jgi:hypothetical protein
MPASERCAGIDSLRNDIRERGLPVLKRQKPPSNMFAVIIGVVLCFVADYFVRLILSPY